MLMPGRGRAANTVILGKVKVIFLKYYPTRCNEPRTPKISMYELFTKIKKFIRDYVGEIMLVGSWEGSPYSLQVLT